jgi:drug/metabolite transporter superfamily protein YnfA
MALCAAVGLLFWRSGMPIKTSMVFWVTPVASAFVLWRFWRGSNWARWLVLAAAIVIAVPNGIIVAWLKEPLNGRAFPGWRIVFIAEALLGAFLIVWLNTRQVRSYFRSRRVSGASNAG